MFINGVSENEYERNIYLSIYKKHSSLLTKYKLKKQCWNIVSNIFNYLTK